MLNRRACIDTNGTWVIPPVFDILDGFSGGLAGAVSGKKSGYIGRP